MIWFLIIRSNLDQISEMASREKVPAVEEKRKRLCFRMREAMDYDLAPLSSATKRMSASIWRSIVVLCHLVLRQSGSLWRRTSRNVFLMGACYFHPQILSLACDFPSPTLLVKSYCSTMLPPPSWCQCVGYEALCAHFSASNIVWRTSPPSIQWKSFCLLQSAGKLA